MFRSDGVWGGADGVHGIDLALLEAGKTVYVPLGRCMGRCRWRIGFQCMFRLHVFSKEDRRQDGGEVRGDVRR
jgi:hypothetical protein